MKRIARSAPLLAAASLLSGCIYVGDWGDSDAFKQDFHSTHPLEAGGRISVESFNGSIEITAWDQSSVEINGTKHASFRDALDEIKIDVNSNPNSLRIRALRGGDRFHGAGVRFSLRVPRQAVLELASTSNGRIEVDGVEGKARLHSSNGGMRLMRVKGEFEAETTNGTIDVQDLRGNANFHTSNGSVHAEASGGSFEAVTTNGRIEVRLNDPASGPVRLHSSNGHIELTLDSKQLPEVRASTTNSSILLRLPPMSDARVRAYTSHSNSVTSEFDELRRDDDSRRRARPEMDGNIGHGGPLLELETTNGSIRIQKL